VEKGLVCEYVSAYRPKSRKFDAFAQKTKLSLEAVSRDDLMDLWRDVPENWRAKRGAASGELRNSFDSR